jgi:hypothetical protein
MPCDYGSASDPKISRLFDEGRGNVANQLGGASSFLGMGREFKITMVKVGDSN